MGPGRQGAGAGAARADVPQRGYFGMGIENVSKAMNLGALMRTAHAFGASFVFTIGAHHKVRDVRRSDTSRTYEHLPYYDWDDLSDMAFPRDCQLVGVELTDDASQLPSFKHPKSAAYVMGREKGSLTPELMERCDHIVKIPTKFCVNVSVAGAIVMYDRLLSTGSFEDRPLMPGGPNDTPA